MKAFGRGWGENRILDQLTRKVALTNTVEKKSTSQKTSTSARAFSSI